MNGLPGCKSANSNTAGVLPAFLGKGGGSVVLGGCRESDMGGGRVVVIVLERVGKFRQGGGGRDCRLVRRKHLNERGGLSEQDKRRKKNG